MKEISLKMLKDYYVIFIGLLTLNIVNGRNLVFNRSDQGDFLIIPNGMLSVSLCVRENFIQL